MHEGVVKHELRGCCVFGLKLQWRNVLCFWSHFSQETIFVHLRFLLPGKIRAILWNVDYKSVINIKVNYTHVSLDMAIQYVSWKTSDQSKSQTFSNLYLITIWTQINWNTFCHVGQEYFITRSCEPKTAGPSPQIICAVGFLCGRTCWVACSRST